ncbi:hypothetical protein KKF19_03460 [Patescibacteria group bacterium]|nr:hypothetical protein [Patescibacteria group bacterium]
MSTIKIAKGAVFWYNKNMHIDSYNFGEIMIDGKRYDADIIIYPNKVKKWWRKQGHEVCIDDIKEAVDEGPDVLIIGAGTPGLMKVLKETEEYLEKQGIELIAEPTEKAVQIFNRLCLEKK